MERRFVLGMLLLATGLLVLSCSGIDQEAIDAYHRRVVTKLSGNPLENNGLGRIVALTLGDLDCGEPSICQNPVWFQYIAQEVPQRQAWVADYQGFVCRNDSVNPPPSSMEFDHEQLCRSLQALFNALDAVLMNVRAVGLLIDGQTLASGVKPHIINQLAEMSQRIGRERESILAIRDDLGTIDWLAPAL